MAKLYFRRERLGKGWYLSFVKATGINNDSERSWLNLKLMEYRIYAGDIAGPSSVRRNKMRQYRRAMRQRGHEIIVLKRARSSTG